MQRLGRTRTCYGVVHLAPLPGTPFYRAGSFRSALARAVESAQALDRGGAHGCLLQTADRVYGVEDECDPARLTAVALITEAVRVATRPAFEVGVQIMRNASRASLAVAEVCGGSFVRVGAIVGETLSWQGRVTPDPATVMAYRRAIDAWDVKVIADVASMHFSWPGGDRQPGEIARTAMNVGADAVCLGDPDETRTLELIAQVRRAAPAAPVYLAGHTDHDNAARLVGAADGVFVAGCVTDGGFDGDVSEEKVRSYMDILESLPEREPA
ncbi:BtpA/SgcQ family protein [Plantactinospora mayteni]|uniref:Phosphorybosylanthranilate isomerase n=1 Tax=Plantactinospora mayteni TaxID=566021 RepID=A0ABQ4EID3_9ACTN|nr:BtpA/SgcQ family protein [Plantactinospora mayteni]GIG94498.1 phosphorybosylanthranilate isomerase [Plantactinospora mayteni]